MPQWYACVCTAQVLAHGGGLDGNCGHRDNIRGGYHYHTENCVSSRDEEDTWESAGLLLLGIIVVSALAQSSRKGYSTSKGLSDSGTNYGAYILNYTTNKNIVSIFE